MLLLAPDLLLAARLHQSRFAVDRRADAAQRGGVDVQEETGQAGPRRLWWGRALAP